MTLGLASVRAAGLMGCKEADDKINGRNVRAEPHHQASLGGDWRGDFAHVVMWWRRRGVTGNPGLLERLYSHYLGIATP